MSGGWCRSYDRKIEHFMNLYPEAWGLIYQADVRTRNELAPKLRTEMQYKFSKDLANGTAHQNDFNPSMPWDSVFERIITGEIKWWTEMVDRPGMCIITDAAKVTKFIDGDALVRKFGRRDRDDDDDRDDRPPLKRRKTAGGGGGNTGAASSWSHPYQNNQYENRGGANDGGAHLRVDQNTNLYTTTKAGHSVCRGFQNGTCVGGANGRCGRDPAIAHQCGVCLMFGHAAWKQAKCPKQGGGNPGAGGGRGRGRGRGRFPGRGGKAWGRGGKAE